RAHAHHVCLGARVPASTAFACEGLAHVVPHVLGVDEHAVEVEDDDLYWVRGRVQPGITLSRSMSRADVMPARPSVRSKSARRLRIPSRTPVSPPAARPYT